MKDILIVEDDKSIREVMIIFCGTLDQRCRGAATLQEGIKELARKKPDIIFLDILLDGENGMLLVDVARKLYDPVPKIVAVSAVKGCEEITKQYDIPCIKKPFDLDLIEKIILSQK